MAEILPIFSSHYSFVSILTLEKAGTSELDGPDSIVDLALENNLKEVILVEKNFSSFIEFYTNCKEAKIKPIFGLKLIVCNNLEEKTEESLSTEHKVIIFMKNSAGYSDLIKISSKASTDGFYYCARTSFDSLNSLWTDNLKLVIPFYDSFLFTNNLQLNTCIPDFNKIRPTFLVESNDLPFDNLLREKVNNYCQINRYEVMESQSIYYKNRKDFSAYCCYRTIRNRSSMSNPNLSHFSSDSFCFEHYLERKNGVS